MKQVISVISGLNILTLTSSFVVSCDWKTPPISVEQLNHIFYTANEQVINANQIPQFNEKLTMPWNYTENDQTIEKARAWSDSIVANFSSKLAAPDLGYLNKGLNLLTGEVDEKYLDEELNITTEVLNNMQSYYFTARISDIATNDNEKIWLSDQKYNNKDIKKTPIKINDKTIEIQEKNKPNEYSENYYSAIDIGSIWALGNEEMESSSYIIRFLFSFGPSSSFNINPTVFYIDVEMSK
ncbi:hypothetical protein [Spiroplasma culicicola]|uniref:Lipoprotein n=1 Tax=Spiroplasma culicicola AES-1 TaxID=1276246 RepID=W6AHT2_9MOLU|nr:hypothetical protein [Spiroplasma culicicola]AHI53249.1 hypothetical protein SCULI_v1c09090 [Spiroplasma culicicola AES-1]